jgi:hypothetical protein
MPTSYEEKFIKDTMVELAEAEGVDLGMPEDADETLRVFAHSLGLNMRALQSDFEFYTADIDGAIKEFDGILDQLEGVINRIDGLGLNAKAIMQWGEFEGITEADFVDKVFDAARKQKGNEALNALAGADGEKLRVEFRAEIARHYKEPAKRQLLRNDLVEAAETLKENFELVEPLYGASEPVKWQNPKQVVLLMAFRRALRQVNIMAECPIRYDPPKTLKAKSGNNVDSKGMRWRKAIEAICNVLDVEPGNLERNWEYAQEIESRANQTKSSWSDAVTARDKARD